MVKVMTDTSVILHYLFEIDINKHQKSVELFKKAVDGKIKLIITSRILDELIFKSLVLVTGLNVKKLKCNRSILAKYSYVIDNIFEFINDFEIDIVEIKLSHYKKVKYFIEQYGILLNDCLTLIAMNSLNLKYIATFDSDFHRTNVDNFMNLL